VIFRAHANRYFGSAMVKPKWIEAEVVSVILLYFVKGISESIIVPVSKEAYELPLKVESHALSVLLILVFNKAFKVLNIFV
jgi:hypothetical protein